MNTVIASCVLGAIVIWLLFIIIAKPAFSRGVSRKFVIATTAVYLSGGLLLLIISFAMKSLPYLFMIISEVSILSVYLISLFGVLRLARQINDLWDSKNETKAEEDT